MSDIVMRSESAFAVYSVVLAIFPLAMVILVLLQRAADRYQSKTSQIDRDRTTTGLVYAIYLSGLFCCLVGFALHVAPSKVWCENIGLIPCFALLGLSKSVLYLFFLRRAKFAAGIIDNTCFKLFFDVIAPVYLFVYWMIYCILTAIVFTGNYSTNATISNCSILGEWAQGFSIFAGFVELFNSAVSVTIFTYPLIRTMYQVKLLGSGTEPQFMSKSDLDTKLQFISLMKWNVILTLIATLSSVTNLFMLLVAGHYIWLFCLGDPFINGLCVFLMIAPNREYVSTMCGCNTASRSSNKIQCDIKPLDIPSGNVPTDTSATNAVSAASATNAVSETSGTAAITLTTAPTVTVSNSNVQVIVH
eukprot:1127713_1